MISINFLTANPRLCRGPRIQYGVDICRMLESWPGVLPVAGLGARIIGRAGPVFQRDERLGKFLDPGEVFRGVQIQEGNQPGIERNDFFGENFSFFDPMKEVQDL
jgi:hypothetical protein